MFDNVPQMMTVVKALKRWWRADPGSPEETAAEANLEAVINAYMASMQ